MRPRMSRWPDANAMVEIHALPEKWLPVSIAPTDRDLEVCVIELGRVHALIFPCRKKATGWVDASTGKLVNIAPTHWRLWADR